MNALLFVAFIVSQTDLSYYKMEDIGNFRVIVSSYGLIGHGFNRSFVDPDTHEPIPSGEFPKNSGIEHVYRAGIWVGAKSPSGTHVSTAVVNNAYPIPGASAGFEFAPPFRNEAGYVDTAWVKSSLLYSPYYSPDAVSEKDIYATFFDHDHFRQDTVPYHVPLGIRVDERIYAWSYSYIQDNMFIIWTIHNDGTVGALDSVYISLYIELATGSREFWGSDFSTTPYFQHKRLYSVTFEDGDTLFDKYQAFYEKNDGYDYIAAPYMAGVRFLGFVKDSVMYPGDSLPDSLHVSYVWWRWSENRGDDPDSIRYMIMQRDTCYQNVDDDYVMNNGYPDPIPMMTVGPIPRLRPGDSIQVAFALIFGGSKKEFIQNAEWAIKAFRSGYILPAPPPSPRLVAVPEKNRVLLYFTNDPEFARDPAPPHLRDFEYYRIYRGLSPDVNDTSWILLAQYDKLPDDTIQDVDHSGGYNVWFPDPPRADTVDTVFIINTEHGVDTIHPRYVFVDDGVKNGFTYYYAITSADVGNPDAGLPSLESSKLLNLVKVVPGTPPNRSFEDTVGVYPNPYRGSSIWQREGYKDEAVRFYNLPENAEILIYNQSGKLIRKIEHSSDMTGEEVWDLKTDYGFPVAPGTYLYVVRDVKTGKIQKGKLIILR